MSVGGPQGVEPAVEDAVRDPSPALVRDRALLLACMVANATAGTVFLTAVLGWWWSGERGWSWWGSRGSWGRVRWLLDAERLGWPMLAIGFGAATLVASAVLGKQALGGSDRQARVALLAGALGALLVVGAILGPVAVEAVTSDTRPPHIAVVISSFLIASAPGVCAALSSYGLLTQRRLFGVMADNRSRLDGAGVPEELHDAAYQLHFTALLLIGVGLVVGIANTLALVRNAAHAEVGAAIFGIISAVASAYLCFAAVVLARAFTRRLELGWSASQRVAGVVAVLALSTLCQFVLRISEFNGDIGVADWVWLLVFGGGPLLLGAGPTIYHRYRIDALVAHATAGHAVAPDPPADAASSSGG